MEILREGTDFPHTFIGECEICEAVIRVDEQDLIAMYVEYPDDRALRDCPVCHTPYTIQYHRENSPEAQAILNKINED